MSSWLLNLFLSLNVLFSPPSFGHGEDKLGPHGGFIQMPGAFHTEVVVKNDQVQVYLLDLDWKNPSILDSSVDVQLVNKKKTFDLTCATQSKFFNCKLPQGASLQTGQLKIQATREKQKGNRVSYDLPLKLK